ncbi:ESX secretion-associated protein EspG [Nocardia callitridis]|uniref:ESX secretion-associated protein EspG n=1 Tax=Nocardia callitridis TaxID=648753 RepID=A0ABP9KXL3_9NOCA
MTRTWRLTDLEFVVAWEDSKEGFLPHPFIFTSRIPLWEDYLREQARVRAELASKMDESFTSVLDTLARPDIRLEVTAWDANKPDNPDRCLRVLAVRQGDRAILATQLPGETVRHSGGFTFAEGDALSLADMVADVVPSAEAGSRKQLVLAGTEAEDTDYSYGQSDVFDSFDSSSPVRSTAFLEEPVTTIGLIRIVQGGSRFGPRGITSHWLVLRDLADDGRYVIDDQNPPVAQSADRNKLVTLINTRIATVVRAIKDERA